MTGRKNPTRSSVRLKKPSASVNIDRTPPASLQCVPLQKEFITRLASRIAQSEQERANLDGPSGRQPYIPSDLSLWALAEIYCSQAAVDGMCAQFFDENSLTEEGESSKVHKKSTLYFINLHLVLVHILIQSFEVRSVQLLCQI